MEAQISAGFREFSTMTFSLENPQGMTFRQQFDTRKSGRSERPIVRAGRFLQLEFECLSRVTTDKHFPTWWEM